MPTNKLGNCCCGTEPLDPCSDGVPLTPYIWFDHDHNGTYEDGPYAMPYDATLDGWTYTLIKSATTFGVSFLSRLADSACAWTTAGTVGMYYGLKLAPGTTNNRVLSGNEYFCDDPSTYPDCTTRTKIGVTSITWAVVTGATYPNGILLGTPAKTCIPGNPARNDGYLPFFEQKTTDPCGNRIALWTWPGSSDSGISWRPSIVITRSNSSSS